MKIKVYAPSFCDQSALDQSNNMELPENAKVSDVYRKLKIPVFYRPIVLCAVNHEFAKFGQTLEDGDVISFLIPIAGG